MTIDPNKLLNRQEAADYLGVTKGTLEVWASTGRYNLPFVKIGRLAKYRFGDLLDFISARTIEHTGAE
jgi:excisionase family DNA binding protein